MANIGSYSFTRWEGELAPAGRVSRMIPAPPGVDGHGAVFGGWRSQPATISTGAEVATDLAADSAEDGYRGMVGTSVAVIDGYGRSWSDVLVMDVRLTRAQTLTGTVYLSATWVLLVETTAP